MYDYEDGLFFAGIILLVGVVVALIVGVVVHTDNVNRRFTDRCHSLGGTAIISDKDLCVRNGLIVDHE